MTRSVRSLLRQASVLLLLFSFGAVLVAPALAQDGPAPEPAPPGSQTPKPEAVPGAKPQPAPPARTRVTPPPAPPPAAPLVPAPQPLVVSPPAPQPVLEPAPAQVKTQAQTRETTKPKRKPSRAGTTKQAAKRALPSLTREEATSSDTMLMVGGLALFVLVLADTVFLTLSTRYLRGAKPS